MRHALAAALLLFGCASSPETAPVTPPATTTPPATPSPPDTTPVTPPTTRADEQADYATSLFMESCVAHITKPAELERWIQEHGLPESEPELEKGILAGEAGKVWSAASPLGQFFVIVTPINASMSKCSVWAHRANADRLNQHFERLLKGTARPGLEVGPVSDQPIEGPGGAYRQLIYFLHKEGVALGWVFVAITSGSEEAEIQGRLMVAPGQGEKIFAPAPPAPEQPEKPQ
jgi:hypothetical protein